MIVVLFIIIIKFLFSVLELARHMIDAK